GAQSPAIPPRGPRPGSRREFLWSPKQLPRCAISRREDRCRLARKNQTARPRAGIPESPPPALAGAQSSPGRSTEQARQSAPALAAKKRIRAAIPAVHRTPARAPNDERVHRPSHFMVQEQKAATAMECWGDGRLSRGSSSDRLKRFGKKRDEFADCGAIAMLSVLGELMRSVADSSGYIYRRRILRRDPDHKQRTAFPLVLAGNLAAMILNHSVYRAQAQARTFSDRLGGVEGIEDPLRLPNPPPRIGKKKNGLFVLTLCGNFQGPSACFFQRVHRVLDDLDKRLEQSVGIALHAGKIGINGEAHTNLSRWTPRLQHLLGPVQQDADVYRNFFRRRLLGKAQQIRDQITGSPGLVHDLAH